MSEEPLQGVGQEAPWTANDSTFAARLVLVRQRMGWNAKEAALACGIPQQSWRTWESGTMPHGSRYFAVCEQIAKAVGCDYGWLVDRRPSGTTQATVCKLGVNLEILQGAGNSTITTSPMLHSLPATGRPQ